MSADIPCAAPVKDDNGPLGSEEFSDDGPLNPPERAPPGEPEDLTPDKDGGVIKQVLRIGWGDSPFPGDKVRVHYHGTLEDGTKFDSSYDRNELFEFDLGKGSVIKAWDIGVATMKRNEKAKFICKSQYAYGEQGSGKIPPDATLIFEIELKDWKEEDISPKGSEGMIFRRILRKGDGFKTPNDGAALEAHIIGRFENREFDNREVKFVVGEGFESDVVDGIDYAIKKFKQGEKSRLKIKSKYAFGKDGKEAWQIPPNSDVEYDVELKNFERAKEAWEMDLKEKLEQADLAKTRGTAYFKDGNYKLAVKQYKKVIDFLENENDCVNEDKQTRTKLMAASYFNMSMCYIKTNIWYEAYRAADHGLEFEINNEKGLFRRGLARFEMTDYLEAERDFKRVVEIDPSNKAARNQLILCKERQKAEHNAAKKKYFGMFDKFAKMDEKKAKTTRETGDGLNTIGDWKNEEAEGMMSLEQEAAAFGEDVKKKEEKKDKSEKINSEKIPDDHPADELKAEVKA